VAGRRATLAGVVAFALTWTACAPDTLRPLEADVRLTAAPGRARGGVDGSLPSAGGARLFLAAGCGGCHTLAGLPGASGVAGPSLTNVVLRPTLAGETIPMTPETLTRFLLDPASVKAGSPMPNVGLTEPQARELAEYLYRQPRRAGE
jgi:cytochrome c1